MQLFTRTWGLGSKAHVLYCLVFICAIVKYIRALATKKTMNIVQNADREMRTQAWIYCPRTANDRMLVLCMRFCLTSPHSTHQLCVVLSQCNERDCVI